MRGGEYVAVTTGNVITNGLAQVHRKLMLGLGTRVPNHRPLLEWLPTHGWSLAAILPREGVQSTEIPHTSLYAVVLLPVFP